MPTENDISMVECPECGHEQPDMGRGVRCEECGFGPMPALEDTPDAD